MKRRAEGRIYLGHEAGEIGAGEEEAVERRFGRGGGGRGGGRGGGGRRWGPGGGGGRGCGGLAAEGSRRRRVGRPVAGEDAEGAPPRRGLGSLALLHRICRWRERGMGWVVANGREARGDLKPVRLCASASRFPEGSRQGRVYCFEIRAGRRIALLHRS
jgi:hypothetical protein